MTKPRAAYYATYYRTKKKAARTGRCFCGNVGELDRLTGTCRQCQKLTQAIHQPRAAGREQTEQRDE